LSRHSFSDGGRLGKMAIYGWALINNQKERTRDMKKITLIISMAILVLSAGIVLAQMSRSGGMMGNEGKGMMMGGNMMNMPMMSGMGMAGMMGGMMGGNILATKDGGVIVVSYDRLYKFDKNLKLVKQADIPFDKEHIQRMMQNMRNMGMMWGWGPQGSESTESQK
jgi:hypothetical protein